MSYGYCTLLTADQMAGAMRANERFELDAFPDPSGRGWNLLGGTAGTYATCYSARGYGRKRFANPDDALAVGRYLARLAGRQA